MHVCPIYIKCAFLASTRAMTAAMIMHAVMVKKGQRLSISRIGTSTFIPNIPATFGDDVNRRSNSMSDNVSTAFSLQD